MPQQNTDEAHEISSDELEGKTAQLPIPSIEDSNSVIGASNITTEMPASSKSAEVPSENSGQRISVSNPTGEHKIDLTLDSSLSFSSPDTHPDLPKQTSHVTIQDSQSQRLEETPVYPPGQLSQLSPYQCHLHKEVQPSSLHGIPSRLRRTLPSRQTIQRVSVRQMVEKPCLIMEV